jgi:hypothetical protein
MSGDLSRRERAKGFRGGGRLIEVRSNIAQRSNKQQANNKQTTSKQQANNKQTTSKQQANNARLFDLTSCDERDVI